MNTNPHYEIESAGEFTPGFEEEIKLFRSAMNHIAEREMAGRQVAPNWLVPARKRQRSAQRRVALAWTCAAALCLAVLPISMQKATTHQPQAAPNVAVTASPSSASDTALLDQVDTAIATPVPTSLAPLTEMDNWNTDTSTGTSLQSTEKKNVTE
jgi:hypothetical protein